MNAQRANALHDTPLANPTDLELDAARDLAGALNILLADMFGLCVKTKNFHWHISGPHFFAIITGRWTNKATSFSPPPTPLPSGCARSAARPYVRSPISAACNASKITMRSTCLLSTCSPS